jgi:Clp amino terminal domain, pathogenicity island component
MLEQLTEPAREALARADDAARALEHSRVGAEHLLLGLLGDERNLACRTLDVLGVSREVLRVQVEELSGWGWSVPPPQLPLTREADQVLDLSLEEAILLGNAGVGTGHLLLGLLRQRDCAAARALVELGADLAAARDQVRDQLALPGELVTAAAGTRVPAAPGSPRGGAAAAALAGGQAVQMLRGVLPIARAFDLPGGRRLLVLSLDLWSGGCELHYTVQPADGGRLAAGQPPGSERWRVTDEVGTAYRTEQDRRRLQVRADEPSRPASARVTPAPPGQVKALTFTLEHAGLGELARVEASLDLALPLAGPDREPG